MSNGSDCTNLTDDSSYILRTILHTEEIMNDILTVDNEGQNVVFKADRYGWNAPLASLCKKDSPTVKVFNIKWKLLVLAKYLFCSLTGNSKVKLTAV